MINSNLRMEEIDMKKTAVLLYDSFCNFEISTVLEILALAENQLRFSGLKNR